MKLRTFACLIVVSLAAFGFAGCGGNDDDGEISAVEQSQGKGQQTEEQKKQEAENFSSEAAPVPLMTGDLTGVRVSEPTVYVIHSKKDLDALVKRHNTRGVSGEKSAAVDFETRQAVGVFLPPQKKGTILAVNDVYEQDGTVMVKAVKLLPGKGCGTPADKPRSFSIVETRDMNTDKSKLLLTSQTGQEC